MGITKFNRSEFLFKDTEKFDVFKTLEELYTENGREEQYKVLGVFTYVSSYGEGCFIKSEGFNISLPSHMVDTVKEIRADVESVDQINSGGVYVNIYTYSLQKYPDKVFYSVNFTI